MKNAKTEEEKKQLQKDWDAIDEKQRYSPISTPGTYWDLKTGRPFTVKEERNFFEPVLVTATRALCTHTNRIVTNKLLEP